jgi:succinyl-CoA synthetase beta subunit
LIILDLNEFQGKQVWLKYGIPVPNGVLISSAEQTVSALRDLKSPYMVKAQIRAGGRGKAGGIKTAYSTSEAQKAVSELLGAKVKDLTVNELLIEEKVSVKKELYIGLVVDRFSRSYVLLSSRMGGVDIDELAMKTPETINRTAVDPQLGIRSFHALSIAKSLGYSGSQLTELSLIIERFFRAFIENDAELAEINPLVETDMGKFVAVDARLLIDDNAIFRHPEYQQQTTEKRSPQQALAEKYNLAYVKLDGDIGVVGNGAGLVMATVDLLHFFGGKPADFLDLGGGANAQTIRAALQIVLDNPEVKSVLVNVLGGITQGDEVAYGILEAIKDAKIRKPLVVRLVGTNEKEGQKILRAGGVNIMVSLEGAAKRAVELAAGVLQ